MKAEIKHYRFDISCPEQGKEYQELRNKLRKTVKTAMPHMGSSKLRDVTEVTLDPKHLFDNQWNTEEGYRVMEWQYSVHENMRIKEGYYLVLPKEAVELRERKRKCGYCGELSDTEGVHLKCVKSEYINLKTLRLAYFGKIIDPVFPDPTEDTLASFYQGKKAWALKTIEGDLKTAERDYQEALKGIEYNRELVELGFFDLDNVIYYKHKKTLSIGWRTPLSMEETLRVKELLKGASFNWEFHK